MTSKLNEKADITIGNNYQIRVNFSFEKIEDAYCSYCGAIGKKQNIIVESMSDENGLLEKSSDIFKEAEQQLKLEMLHGQAVCKDVQCLTKLARYRKLKKGPPAECED